MRAIKRLPAIILSALALALFGCGGVAAGPEPSEEVPEPGQPAAKCVDVFIFMGQSNMAGRGIEFEEAIPCAEGHGYEYRAVTGSDEAGWLYPVVEPFGKYENNDALSDLSQGDGKKSGSMVSAFCESYYKQSGVPVVAVSASVGATSIRQWTPGTAYFGEAKRRLAACLAHLGGAGLGEVRHVNMVWCQGESDGGNVANGMDYNSQLVSIVEGLSDMNGRSVEHCFIIPPSEYTDGEIKPAKTAVAEGQIRLCGSDARFVLATLKLRNVPLKLRADPHFHQGVYNVAGWDAGARAARFLETGEATECTVFEPGEEMQLALEYGIELTYYC